MEDKKVDSMAEVFFKKIGIGKDTAVTRPIDPRVDRRFRKLIEEAQKAGEIIINTGEGYYRPNLENPVEYVDYLHYIAQKRSRIRAHLCTIAAMEKAASEFITDIEREVVLE